MFGSRVCEVVSLPFFRTNWGERKREEKKWICAGTGGGGGGVTLPTWTKIQLCQSVGKGQKEDKSALDLAGVKHEIFVKAHLSFLYELTTIF